MGEVRRWSHPAQPPASWVATKRESVVGASVADVEDRMEVTVKMETSESTKETTEETQNKKTMLADKWTRSTQ